MNMNITNTEVAVSAPLAVSKGRGNPTPIKFGAITYKSIKAAARSIAKQTGEDEGTVYGRIYQRSKAGKTAAQIMSKKALKKGKKGMDVVVGNKTYPSLMDAIKASFKKETSEELAVRYTRVRSRMEGGMSFEDAIKNNDLRGQANGNETIVNGVTYPSLMDAIRKNVKGLTEENEGSIYIRFVTGMSKGKTFETILATPVRAYTRKSMTPKEAIDADYEEQTALLETIREQAEESIAA